MVVCCCSLRVVCCVNIGCGVLCCTRLLNFSARCQWVVVCYGLDLWLLVVVCGLLLLVVVSCLLRLYRCALLVVDVRRRCCWLVVVRLLWLCHVCDGIVYCLLFVALRSLVVVVEVCLFV